MSGWPVLRTFASVSCLTSVGRPPRRRVFLAVLSIAPVLLLAATVRPARAQAVKVEHCNNPTHTLPAGDKDTDLQVTNGIHCIVDGCET
jgi:hypothetical protein